MVLDGAVYPRMLNAGGRCALCRRPLRPRQHLRSPLPHLRRDWTHPCLICPGVDVVRGEPSSGGYAGGTSPLRYAALPLRYRCGCAPGHSLRTNEAALSGESDEHCKVAPDVPGHASQRMPPHPSAFAAAEVAMSASGGLLPSWTAQVSWAVVRITARPNAA